LNIGGWIKKESASNNINLIAGISFNGDTAAANALDDYETGTWTPTLGGDTTYITQTGTYTKIGKSVSVQGYITVNVLGTGSPETVSGLPFTSGTLPSAVQLAYFGGLARTVVSLSPHLNSTSTTFSMYGLGGADSTAALLSVFGNGTRVHFAATYRTA